MLTSVLDLVSKLGGRKAHFCWKRAANMLHLTCAFSHVCHVVVRNCVLQPTSLPPTATYRQTTGSYCCRAFVHKLITSTHSDLPTTNK